MTNEDYKNELDWLRNNWPLLGRFEYKPDEAVHTTIGRVAELLYLHAFGTGRLGAAVSASRPYEIGLNERLKDPVYAAAYTKALIEDGVSASPQPKVAVHELMRGGENGWGESQYEVLLGTVRLSVFTGKPSAEKFAATVRAQFFAAAPAQEPLEMYLCETQFLFLKPNQLYKFTVHPECDGCKQAAAQEQPVENSRSVTGAINGCGCVCHTVGLFGLMCCPCTKKDLDELVNGKRGVPVAPQPTER